MVNYTLFLLGNVTTTDYPLADIARATNTAKFNLANKIFRAQDAWDFDDTANSDFPIATTTFVNSQADYPLPTDAIALRRVEVKDINGNWTKLDKIDETNIDMALDEFQETDGIPLYYRVEGGSMVLYPAPDTAMVTATAGLKVYYDRAIDEFTAATTTTEVGMGDSGDQIIAYEVAEEWARIFRPDRVPLLQTRRQELESSFLERTSHKMKGSDPRLQVIFERTE